MIKIFEDSILLDMEKKLVKNANKQVNSVDAIDYLYSAITALEEANLDKYAEETLNIIKKIGSKVDKHTAGLTSEKMIENLLDHGTEFNLSEDINFDDIDLDNLEVVEDEPDDDFEDED